MIQQSHSWASIQTKLSFKKTHQHPFLIKKKNNNSPESGHRGNLPQHIKAIYENPTANIILNGEKLKAVLLRSGTR